MPRTLRETQPTCSRTLYPLLREYPVHPTASSRCALSSHSASALLGSEPSLPNTPSTEEDEPTAAIPRHHSRTRGVVYAEHGVSPSGVRSVHMPKSPRTSSPRALGDWPKRRVPEVKMKRREAGPLQKTLEGKIVGPLTNMVCRLRGSEVYTCRSSLACLHRGLWATGRRGEFPK